MYKKSLYKNVLKKSPYKTTKRKYVPVKKVVGPSFSGYTNRQRLNQQISTHSAGRTTFLIPKTNTYIPPPLKSSSAFTAPTQADTNMSLTGVRHIWPSRGGAVNQRLGSEIILKSLEIRLQLVASAAAVTAARVCLFQIIGQNANGSFPVPSGTPTDMLDILFSPSPSTMVAPKFPTNLLFNTQTKQQYRVLYDQQLDVNDGYYATPILHIQINDFPIKKIHFTQDISNSSQPGVTDGLILMMVCTDQPPDSGTPVNYNYAAKLNYTDT